LKFNDQKDIRSTEDLSKIREMSGVCPQHDAIYDDLNCIEHLELFANLKNVDPIKLKTEVYLYLYLSFTFRTNNFCRLLIF
jgi:ABC-type multidrug transport system ATPase subunit